jgi:drug/metabolite transporter (DMT)-like permease
MATLYAMVTAALVLFPFAVVEAGWSRLAAASPIAIVSLLYLGTFGTAVGFVLYFEGVSRIGVIRSGSFAYLIPVCGVILSVIFLGERLTALTVAGGLLVLCGLWIVQRGSAATAAGAPPARDPS